jgi:DNA-binding response OmpR family regulator
MKLARKRSRILLVDDEPDITILFKIALEDAGFIVHPYNDPLIALSEFKLGYYDLIIVDIKMPSMDGFTLYDELKREDNKAKICFLTASEMYYEESRKVKHRSLGKDLFIRKPITTEELIERITALISK